MDILTSIETVMDSDLLHYGRKGMKWGVRNGPPYPLHPEQLSSAEKKARRSVFISGSSKTQFEDSGYYRKELPKAIQNKIDDYIKDHAHIIVGDAPGIDRQVQDYLNDVGYDNVEIYGPGKQVRYAANAKWKTNPVDAPEFEEMSPEWLRKKDIAMTNDATEGLAIVLDDGAQATRNNVARLREQGKQAEVFILNKTGDDDWEHTQGSYETLGKALERLTVEKFVPKEKTYKFPDLTPEQKQFLFKDEDQKELSEAGRKVLEKYEAGNTLTWIERNKSDVYNKEGVKILDDQYQIDKGAHVRRIASANEPVDERHKYVSLTEDDAYQYNAWGSDGALGTDYHETSYTYEYSTKKKLKVADEKQVIDYLAEAYGGPKTKQRVNDYIDYIHRHTTHSVHLGKDETVPSWYNFYVSEYADKAKDFVTKMTSAAMFKQSLKPNEGHDDVYTHFKKLGYDAIVDAEDYMSDEAELPLVILNPKKSLKLVKSEEWLDYSLTDAYRDYQKSKTLSHSDFFAAVELVLPDDALQYGVLGQQWGVRHWQNKDGTLTPAGRERWINSLKQEAYAASKKWEEYQAVRKQVVDMHYNGKFDNELEKKMLRLKDEAEEAGAIWGSLRKRVESYLENGPDVSTSEPVEDAPHKVLIPVSDEKKYQHFLELGYVEKGRNDTWIYMVNHKKNIKHSDNQNDVLAAVETVMDGDALHYQRKGAKWGIRNGPPYPLQPEQFSARERMLDPSGKKNIAATGERKKWQKSETLTDFATIPYTGLIGGRLTKLGRKHMDKMLSQESVQDWAKRTKQARIYSLKKAGVTAEDGGYAISDKATLRRIADANDKVDERRKYMSVTDRDSNAYEDIFKKGHLGVQDRENAAAFKYKSKKDLRVASADDVLSYIVDTYGGRKERRLYEDVKRAMPYRDLLKELSRSGLGTAADVTVASYLGEIAPYDLRMFVKRQLWDGSSEQGKRVYANNKQTEILNHYRDLGYDAITDVEDYLHGMELPVIVINPSESVKAKSKKHIEPKREPKEEDPVYKELSKSGIKKVDDKTDVIARGSKFVRQASDNDDQFHDRKYMSVTKKDADYYRKEYAAEGAEYTYEAKKKLKVANAQAVVDYVVQDVMGYGDSEEGKKLSSLYSKYRGDTWDHLFEKRERKKEREQFWKVAQTSRAKYGTYQEHEDTHRQILDHFSQLGYDAIVDINQSWQGMEYPVIVIDPDDSTKLVAKVARRS